MKNLQDTLSLEALRDAFKGAAAALKQVKVLDTFSAAHDKGRAGNAAEKLFLDQLLESMPDLIVANFSDQIWLDKLKFRHMRHLHSSAATCLACYTKQTLQKSCLQ